MKKTLSSLLRSSLALTKKILFKSETIRNAVMDVNNTNEFTNLYEHEKMLADHKRVDPYQKAIARYVKPGDTLVDLGTGSGILAILASRNNPKKVYAIDHSDFIGVARKTARVNNAKNIEFVNVNSRSFDPDEKLDMILHEQIGDELFDENMIENIMDLKKRLLKPGGRILPGKFELYMEPVSLRPDYRVPMIWEMNIHGIDFSYLKESPIAEGYRGGNYGSRYIPPESVDFFLCKPEPVLTVDLNVENPELTLTVNPQKRVAIRPGQMDGICVYFNTIFDEEINLSTDPFNGYCSWGNRLYRTPARKYDAGDMIEFVPEIERIESPETWTFTLSGEVTTTVKTG